MNISELQKFLTDNIYHIFSFMDYETTISTTNDFEINLGEYWFRKKDWNQPNYKFHSLGHTGTGSEIVAWVRPDYPDSETVIIFGSEGSVGVISTSYLNWIYLLTYAPLISEDEPATIEQEGNWYLDKSENQERFEKAINALNIYKKNVISHFGQPPSFKELTSGFSALNTELVSWVNGVCKRTH